MKTSFKLASLAALTAATFALPVAAEEMKGTAKCTPKTEMSKCGAKCAGQCAPKKHAKSAKCSVNKCAPKCAAQCAPKN